MKNSYFIILFLSTSLFSGCSNNDLVEENNTDSINDLSESSIFAEINSSNLTRTTLDASYNVVWKKNDEIRVFSSSVSSGSIYTTLSDNKQTGVFNPVNTKQAVNDEARYAVYPASIAKSSTLTGTSLSLDLSGLSNQPYVAGLMAGANISSLPMIANASSNDFAFQNICGGIKLQLNDYQSLGLKISKIKIEYKGEEQICGTASVDLTNGNVTLPKGEGNKTIVIDCGAGVNISTGGNLNNPKGFVAFMPKGTYTGSFNITITDCNGRCFTATTKNAITINAGNINSLETLPVTLYYGKSNCYRVDGATDINIDVTPYYTLNNSYAYSDLKCVNSDNALVGVPKSAKIIWQQAATGESGDIVSSAAISETSLKVKTSGVKGNAVVAVCDADNVILWSYHIWVSESKDVEYSTAKEGEFTMMDRNLGATSTEMKNRNTYGLFYQWGRKDPFARNLDVTRPAGSPYESVTSDLEKTISASAETGTIAYTIQNPQNRILSSDSWYVGESGNDKLWGFIDATHGIKTVYDPCPEGYRVPDYQCYADMPATDKANCNSQYGHQIATGIGTSTSYFPTGGYLNPNKDALMFHEYRGYLWNNQPGNAKTDPNRFMYNNAGLTISTGDKYSCGMPVRCIKIK